MNQNNASVTSYHTRHSGQRGFSLIEILVVLVVLVIGILTIVRLFPAGFIALRSAQNSTFADRLGQAELESLKQNQGTLADAVYMYADNGFNPSIKPDDLTNFADASYNDINKQRYISNETITVPAPHVINNIAYPPLYTLTVGPIYLPTVPRVNVSPVLNDVPYLKVNGTMWTALSGDSRYDPNDPNSVSNQPLARHITNPPDVITSGQEQFLVDLTAGQIAIPPEDYTQTFLLTITTVGGAPTTVSINLASTTGYPKPYLGGWLDATGLTPFVTGTLPSAPWQSVTLKRTFRCLGSADVNSPSFTWSHDPYEYYIVGDNVGAKANMGVLAFNPLAAGHNGTQPLRAQVSYMALDWHVLHEDHNVPDGGGTVKLILDHLKRVNDVQFNQTTFAGLVPPQTGNTTSYDIMILNLDTGQQTFFDNTSIGDLDNSTAVKTNGAAANISVSYSTGQITLPSTFSGQHLRFYYAGDADWAVALQKAPSTYSVIVDNTPATTLTYVNNLKAVTQNTPNQCVVKGSRIYFPPCDAGKTVEIDGLKYVLNATSGVTHTVPLVSAAISTATDVNNNYYVDLGPIGAGVINSADNADLKSISVNGVRGVSARAIVIWHERNQWRTRATDTLLTRSQ